MSNPSMDWTRAELDDHANNLGIDTTALPNKEAVLDAINNHDQAGKTGVLTYDNRNAYGVMEAATESEKPALRPGERRSGRGIRRR